MATLRELDLEPFETRPADRLPVTAPDDRWVVLIGDDGPVSAAAPGTTLAAGARLPEILVAVADLDQAEAFESDAFAEYAGVSALVLIGPGLGPGQGPAPGGHPVIAGVASGLTLERALFRGAVRGVPGAVLPGVPAISLIVRSCGYAQAGTGCATMMSFASRPYPMPACPNVRGLAAHQFAW